MATIDPSIALGVRPPQIESPMNALARAMQIQGLQQQNQLGQMQMEEMRRGIEDQNALRTALSAPDADPYKVLLGRGKVKEATDYLKGKADVGKTEAETRAKQIETVKKQVDLAGQAFGYVRANPTVENAMAVLDSLERQGIYQPEQVAQMRQMVQQNPQNVAGLADQAFRMALDAKEQLAKFQTNNIGGQTITQGIDPVTGKVKLVSAVQNTQSPDNAASVAATIRGQNMVDARARENNAIQRGAARTEIKETADGFVMIDKGTGAVTPLNGPDGKPLGPKLKEAPPAVQTAVLTNSQNLARAERALALLEGKDIGDPAKGGQKGDKEATGLKGYLPNQVLNRVDPQGVDTRAAIADLGSLVIHDRSGAAVTAAEFPRLAPFIPTEKDDAATAKKKVQRFVQVYREENAAMHQAYNPGTGYKVPGGVAPSPAPTGPKKIANDAEYNSLPSGTEFIAPDGSRRRKP